MNNLSQERIFYEKLFSNFLHKALAKSERNPKGALLFSEEKSKKEEQI